MPVVTLFAETRRKAQYGHRDWLLWRDADGNEHSEVLSERSLLMMKNDMNVIIDKGFFRLITANDGWATLVTRDMLDLMIRNAKYY